MPPRHTKSSIISVTAPAWGWTWRPDFKFLCASYGMGLAIRDSQRCRDLVDCQWYQTLFGHQFQWIPEQNAKQRYENNHHGYRISTSVEGAATGEGGDIISIDDPHNIQEAESEAVRKGTTTWFDNTMTSRLNDQQRGGMIIIGQRVHDTDLIGHVLRQGGWEYLRLPAEYEPTSKTFTSIGWSDPRTEEGEPLWADKFPQIVLDSLKLILQINYFSQYQQRPITEAGTIIKAATMLDYTDEGETYLLHIPGGDDKRVLKFLCRTVVSTDFAVATTQQADYTVFLTWDITPDGEALLIDIFIDKMEGPDAEEKLADVLRATPRLWCVLVEDVAYQKSIIQRLRKGGRDGVGGFPVRPHKPMKDKVSRAQSIAVYFALAYFFFNKNIAGFVDYKKQLLGFPRAENDDMVDATSIMYELYEHGEPMMTSIDVHETKEASMIDQIAESNPELAEFLREGLVQ